MLTGVKVFQKNPGKKLSVKIKKAAADYEQRRFPIAKLTSTKKKQGWAVDGHSKQKGKARYAVFTLARKVKGTIEVHFEFKSKSPRQIFGRFKLELNNGDITPQKLAAGNIFSIEDYALKNSSTYKKLKGSLSKAQKQAKELNYGQANCQITKTVKPLVTRIFPRGNWQDESGEIVEPAVPEFLGKIDTKNKRANRLDLANWLVSKDNPLTARVFVNRLWQSYFGRGLSEVTEDVGSQGETPDNPELLDYLAWNFMNDDWDIKKSVKRILMSRTYRQSTDCDPQIVKSDPFNIKLAHQNARRLEAEYIRDNALQTSGLLNKKIGGASVKPYQPAGYYSQLNFPRRVYKADMNEQQYRRGLYIHRQRTFLHPMLKAFDTPSRDTCSARRTVSNTPLQSLTLLNDPTFLEAAKAFAVKAMGQEESERLGWMVEVSLGRKVEKGEHVLLQKYLQEQKQYFAKNPSAVEAFLKDGLYQNPKRIDKQELAAWTSLARLIFNLHELITVY
ncbi:MAG: DUF1553 domain-containing protein [Lentisphaeraceae bacterium]|nr:DUF1553 domain-containing protein [Lentisphaeraceae bacterium]